MVYKSNASPINLSLSGCGFLGVYHIGVICAFREHAPEVLEGKMAGCSAGSLVAACAMSGCCLGQMCSDALEIAVRARSRALGPLHPTFSIVDIIRNGLRRILPPNAHEICSGRLFISLTRWKDNKNVIISQFHSREELIQVLICSSFVPYWSGIFPHKVRGEYYWDGGLTNNNPIIDDGTILISPFAGESDICPRDESGSFYSFDFRGECSDERVARLVICSSRNGHFVYARESLSAHSCALSTESVGAQANLLARLCRRVEIPPNSEYAVARVCVSY